MRVFVLSSIKSQQMFVAYTGWTKPLLVYEQIELNGVKQNLFLLDLSVKYILLPKDVILYCY